MLFEIKYRYVSVFLIQSWHQTPNANKQNATYSIQRQWARSFFNDKRLQLITFVNV